LLEGGDDRVGDIARLDEVRVLGGWSPNLPVAAAQRVFTAAGAMTQIRMPAVRTSRAVEVANWICAA